MTWDWASFGYGVFAATVVIGAGCWIWWHYGDAKRAQDTLPPTWKPSKR